MRFLHLSPAIRATVTDLIRKGTPVIPERMWSTYPCPAPLFDGTPLSFGQETDDAIRAAVALGNGQDLVTVMLPLVLPGGVDKPLTLDAGFTVVADEQGRLFTFQCVLTAKGQRRFNDNVVETPTAVFIVVPVGNVTAWDLQKHGHGARAEAS